MMLFTPSTCCQVQDQWQLALVQLSHLLAMTSHGECMCVSECKSDHLGTTIIYCNSSSCNSYILVVGIESYSIGLRDRVSNSHLRASRPYRVSKAAKRHRHPVLHLMA